MKLTPIIEPWSKIGVVLGKCLRWRFVGKMSELLHRGLAYLWGRKFKNMGDDVQITGEFDSLMDLKHVLDEFMEGWELDNHLTLHRIPMFDNVVFSG
jgi:hypothetical protein